MFTSVHLSHITCLVSHVTCHMSHVTCHLSYVTCHMSHVTCHMSHVTYHIFLIVEASQWRVCYQRGIPCLVLTYSTWCILARLVINTGWTYPSDTNNFLDPTITSTLTGISLSLLLHQIPQDSGHLRFKQPQPKIWAWWIPMKDKI